VLKIYGVPGSRAIRPLWLLEELGVPYELVKTRATCSGRASNVAAWLARCSARPALKAAQSK
jgi:glutathione S-transferase